MTRDLPSLEPYPGELCAKCGAVLTFDDPPFCGVCVELMRPQTFDEFLSYAAGSTVNGGSGRWGK